MLSTVHPSELSEKDRDFVLRIYKDYGKIMYKAAFGVLHNQQDAEDAVSDAMVKIIKYLVKSQDSNCDDIRSKIVIYIKTIVKNRAIDIYNSNKKRLEFESDILSSLPEDASEHFQPEDISADVESIVITGEVGEIVRKKLHELPTGLRDAIDLVYFSGFSQSEAAELLGIEYGTLRNRLSEARRRMRNILDGESINGG